MTTQNTNENSLSAGAKWSVNFVEHLRTVHFALTSLAVALLILMCQRFLKSSHPRWPKWYAFVEV